MTVSDTTLDTHLEAALQETDNDVARYHIREALQLRIAERTTTHDR